MMRGKENVFSIWASALKRVHGLCFLLKVTTPVNAAPPTRLPFLGFSVGNSSVITILGTLLSLVVPKFHSQLGK